MRRSHAFQRKDPPESPWAVVDQLRKQLEGLKERRWPEGEQLARFDRFMRLQLVRWDVPAESIAQRLERSGDVFVDHETQAHWQTWRAAITAELLGDFY